MRNAIGTINPIKEITKLAHAKALVLDAVHYAPHGLIDDKIWIVTFW